MYKRTWSAFERVESVWYNEFQIVFVRLLCKKEIEKSKNRICYFCSLNDNTRSKNFGNQLQILLVFIFDLWVSCFKAFPQTMFWLLKHTFDWGAKKARAFPSIEVIMDSFTRALSVSHVVGHSVTGSRVGISMVCMSR